MADHHTDIWHKTAVALGWRWSNAHDGYINETHKNQRDEKRHTFETYLVTGDAEQACFYDGIETIEQALSKLELR